MKISLFLILIGITIASCDRHLADEDFVEDFSILSFDEGEDDVSESSRSNTTRSVQDRRMLPLPNGNVACPNCKGEMVKRRGPRGEFFGCAAFPECRGTQPLSATFKSEAVLLRDKAKGHSKPALNSTTGLYYTWRKRKETENKAGEVVSYFDCSGIRRGVCTARKKIFTASSGERREVITGEHNNTCNIEPKERPLKNEVREECEKALKSGKKINDIYQKIVTEAQDPTNTSVVPSREQLYYLSAKVKNGEFPTQDEIKNLALTYGNELLHLQLWDQFGSSFVAIFTSEKLLAALTELGKDIVFIDGTHSLSESKMQVVILMVREPNSDKGVPVAYMITNRKDTGVYELFLDKLVEATKSKFSPAASMSDFEDAIMNAVAGAFPDSEQFGCLFHLQQSVRRKCQKLRLGETTTKSIAAIIRHLYEAVSEDAFKDAWKSAVSKLERLSKAFLEYFRKNYIGGAAPAKYPPHRWAFFSHVGNIAWERETANNLVEGYNRFLKQITPHLSATILVLAGVIAAQIRFSEKELVRQSEGIVKAKPRKAAKKVLGELASQRTASQKQSDAKKAVKRGRGKKTGKNTVTASKQSSPSTPPPQKKRKPQTSHVVDSSDSETDTCHDKCNAGAGESQPQGAGQFDVPYDSGSNQRSSRATFSSPAVLREYLQQHGHQMVETRRDGNCCYIAYLRLLGKPETAEEIAAIRETLAQIIAANGETFKLIIGRGSQFAARVSAIACGDTDEAGWGGSDTHFAFAYLTGKFLWVLYTQGGKVKKAYYAPTLDGLYGVPDDMIDFHSDHVVGYIENSHYVSVGILGD